MTGRRRAAAFGVALVALSGVLLVLFTRGETSAVIVDPETARRALVSTGTLSIVFVACWFGLAAVRSREGSASRRGLAETAEWPGDRPETPAGELLRVDVDRAARARASGGLTAAEQDVWWELRRAAALAEQRATGSTVPEARRAVEDGEWCDDPLATAFLAGESADLTYPVRHAAFEWFTPEKAYRRRVERTATAIQRRYEGDYRSTGAEAAASGDANGAQSVSPADDSESAAPTGAPADGDVVEDAERADSARKPRQPPSPTRNGDESDWAMDDLTSGTSSADAVTSGEMSDDAAASDGTKDDESDPDDATGDETDPDGTKDDETDVAAHATEAKR